MIRPFKTGVSTVTTSHRQDRTRESLLQAGSQIFAEQGFQVARIRDIAQRAGCNLSAINYHFGSKQGLYNAVLEYAVRQAIERHPLVPSEQENLDAPAQFHFLVRGLMRRFVTPGPQALMGRLMVREMANPTQALDQLVERISKPQFAQVAQVMAALVGPDFPPERLRLCVLSLFGQCIVYLFGRPVIERLMPGVYDNEASVDLLAEHVAGFSLAAIRQLDEEAGQ